MDELNPEELKIYDKFMDLEHIVREDGHVFVSIHVVDVMNAIIENTIEDHLSSGDEISEEVVFGVLWTSNLYNMMHDALQMKADVPDSPGEMFGGNDVTE